MNNNFLKDEKDFLLNQGINLDLFRKYKWQWLEKEKDILDLNILNNYFIYVLLPYYIINKDLTRSDLKKLGFNPFLVKLSHCNFHLSKLKNKYNDFEEKDLIFLLGKDIALERLNWARMKINDLNKHENLLEKAFFSDIKSFSDNEKTFMMSNKEKFKWLLSRMYKFYPTYFVELEKKYNDYEKIARKIFIKFIENRFRQSYIANILSLDKRNLLDNFYKYLNMNWYDAKLEYFSKPIYIKYYSKGMRAYEMVPILSKKHIETKEKFGLSKNTIRKHITEIWENIFKKLHNNFSLLDLFLYEKFYHNIEYPRYVLKYKTLIKSVGESKDYGLNYFSFEVRMIKFISVLGLSAFDGYDLYKHLIEGNRASFHHISFIKSDDKFENLVWLPDKKDSNAINDTNYVYHHHPIIKTDEFRKILKNNVLNLSSIIKENDISYLDNIQNYSKNTYALIEKRINNFDWLNGIIYYLPRGTWIKKFKFDIFDYLIKRHIHPKFHNISNLIKNECKIFWEEYLKNKRD